MKVEHGVGRLDQLREDVVREPVGVRAVRVARERAVQVLPVARHHERRALRERVHATRPARRRRCRDVLAEAAHEADDRRDRRVLAAVDAAEHGHPRPVDGSRGTRTRAPSWPPRVIVVRMARHYGRVLREAELQRLDDDALIAYLRTAGWRVGAHGARDPRLRALAQRRAARVAEGPVGRGRGRDGRGAGQRDPGGVRRLLDRRVRACGCARSPRGGSRTSTAGGPRPPCRSTT